jgi:hypothetical protein
MATTTTTKKKTTSTTSSRLPLTKQPGDIGYDKIASQDIVNDPFAFTDTTFNYDNVQAGNVQAGQLADRFLTAADYSLVDPSQIASQYGDINRSETSKNAALSSQLALDALDTELQGLQNYTPAAAALKRGEIANDNTFNQKQRDAQLASGDPTIRSDLMDQAARARSFASGSVPDSIGDKAYELGIRSRAADAAAGGGFGVRSSAARKASELMSAESRIALSQYGDQLLTSNIGNRNSTLLAPTMYSDAGSQISVNPTASASQIAGATASQLNSGNITADKALASMTQQEQFKTGLQQDTNVANFSADIDRDLNQTKLNLQADTSNVDRQLQASTVNAANAISTQSTAMGIKSQENQFNSQLSFNTKNANADRTFQASNINAGRALEVATSNRSLKVQIDQSNNQMIFQDQQARKAEAAANARSAAANATSRANASLSYKSQQDAIAANATASERNYQFQLQQQRDAMSAYEKGIDRSQSAEDNKTLGTLGGLGMQILFDRGNSGGKADSGGSSGSSGSSIAGDIWGAVKGWGSDVYDWIAG